MVGNRRGGGAHGPEIREERIAKLACEELLGGGGLGGVAPRGRELPLPEARIIEVGPPGQRVVARAVVAQDDPHAWVELARELGQLSANGPARIVQDEKGEADGLASVVHLEDELEGELARSELLHAFGVLSRSHENALRRAAPLAQLGVVPLAVLLRPAFEEREVALLVGARCENGASDVPASVAERGVHLGPKDEVLEDVLPRPAEEVLLRLAPERGQARVRRLVVHRGIGAPGRAHEAGLQKAVQDHPPQALVDDTARSTGQRSAQTLELRSGRDAQPHEPLQDPLVVHGEEALAPREALRDGGTRSSPVGSDRGHTTSGASPVILRNRAAVAGLSAGIAQIGRVEPKAARFSAFIASVCERET